MKKMISLSLSLSLFFLSLGSLNAASPQRSFTETSVRELTLKDLRRLQRRFDIPMRELWVKESENKAIVTNSSTNMILHTKNFSTGKCSVTYPDEPESSVPSCYFYDHYLAACLNAREKMSKNRSW